MFKKALSLIICFIMLLSTLAATGITLSAASYSGKCGDNLTWSIDTVNGVLTIDGKGDMYDVPYSSYSPWYSYRSYFESVIIGNSVTSIGDRAFKYCRSLTNVTIPESVKSIGDFAFLYCDSLTTATIPYSVKSIGENAFHDYYSGDYRPISGLLIRCVGGSYAHTYAMDNGFEYELYCDHMFENNYEYVPATCTEDAYSIAGCDHACGATDIIVYEGTALGHSFTDYSEVKFSCTEGGTKTAYCDNGCGLTDVITLEPTAKEHTWSEWIVTVEPTVNSEGEQIRFCYLCDVGESEILPVLHNPNKPVITVDNFTVTITNAEAIKDMRYAPGVYTTTTEIRNAEGNVAISEALVVKNTVDGNFVYEMPSGGMYSIWIRMKDGTNYIMALDVTKVEPSVSSYGVKITLHDLFDVRDFFIAKGEYQTYREIKDNGYITSVTSAKIGNKHDYTYTVYEPGVHTIFIRFNDGRTALFHETLTVTEPTFETNGLQVTIGNIPDVKVIRTAYGEYNSSGDVKRAEGARNFSGKANIKGAEEYTIQYREDGVVTIVVEYNNGYVEIFHYNVQHKQVSCTQAGSSVIFRNLDGLVLIRYAKGEYTTSSQIKKAVGSKVLKAADITGEYAIISGLAKGTYTFCAQFDDDSYNYFKVTIA